MKTGDLIDSAWRLEGCLSDDTVHQTWKASAEGGGGKVVVKALRLVDGTDWNTIDFFRREADALKAISHPDVPRYLASLEHRDGEGYWLILVREFVAGTDLRSLLESGKRFTEAEITDIFVRLIEILSHLHSLRPPLIHGYIHPGNLIRRADGSIALVDFAETRNAAAYAGSVGGTLRSDLYGAAATILFLLSRSEPSDFPVTDGKFDFASTVQEGSRLLPVLTDWLEIDEGKRTLSEADALAVLRGETTGPLFPAPVAARPVGSAAKAASLPMGSRIRVTEGDGTLSVSIPPGSARRLLPVAGFALFWLGFIAFWTLSSIAMGAPLIFPLFSIPFWAVGFFMLFSLLKLAFGRTEIRMDRKTGFIFRETLFFRTRETRVPLAELDRCVVEKAEFGMEGSDQKRCGITAGVKRLAFGSNLTERELVWMAERINAFAG